MEAQEVNKSQLKYPGPNDPGVLQSKKTNKLALDLRLTV